MARPTQLAKTLFQTGIKDTLATVDVYTQNTARAPIDASGASSFDPSSLSSLVGGNLGVSALITKYSAKVGIQINASALLNGVIGSSSTLRSALGAASNGVSSAISAVSGAANIAATIGGITSMIKNTNLSDLTAVASMIGGINNTSFAVNFTDNAGLTGLSVNLLTQANQMGIPNAYAQFSSGMANNPQMLTGVTAGILGSVCATSNVNMLSNIAAGPVARNVNTVAPKFLGNFAANFVLDSSVTPSQLPGIGLQISGAFGSINPNWNKTRRSNGAMVNNSSILLNASADFNSVMDSVASYNKLPLSTYPEVVTNYPPGSSPEPAIYPAGTTSSTVNNADGSSSTTYTIPDGRVVVDTSHADGSNSISTRYPAQGAAIPVRTASSPIVTMGLNALNSFMYPTPEMGNVQTNYAPLTTPPYAQNPVGTLCTTSTNPDGSIVNLNQLPDGGVFVATNYANGIRSTASALYDPTLAYLNDATDDPLASSANYATSDPLIFGSVVNNLAMQSQDNADSNNSTNLMTCNASDALASSFPSTYLGDIGDFDF